MQIYFAVLTQSISLTGRDMFTVTVSCGDIGNISEMVGWITDGGAENGKITIYKTQGQEEGKME